MTDNAVKLLASVPPSLLLVLAVAQYIKPSARDLASIDPTWLWWSAASHAAAFVLAILTMMPMRQASLDGYFIESMIDASSTLNVRELLAQEANEAGGRLRNLRTRGWLVAGSVSAYAAGAVSAACYLYRVATAC